MGEARRRGTYKERVLQAIDRDLKKEEASGVPLPSLEEVEELRKATEGKQLSFANRALLAAVMGQATRSLIGRG